MAYIVGFSIAIALLLSMFSGAFSLCVSEDCIGTQYGPPSAFQILQNCQSQCEGQFEVWGCVNPRPYCSDSCADTVNPSPNCTKTSLCYGKKCLCIKGYARNGNGDCVPVKECGKPKREPIKIKPCGKNEFFSTCLSTCYGDTCDRRYLFLRKQSCNEPCAEKGCVCEFEYARNQTTNECVKVDQCHDDCPPNEVYTNCKDPCLDESCAAGVKWQKPGKIAKCTPSKCKPGCVCRPNFYRNPYANKECVCLGECAGANYQHALMFGNGDE